MALTDKQSEVTGAIRDHWAKHGSAPSYRALARALNTNVGNTHRYVQLLIAKGLVTADEKLGLTCGHVVLLSPQLVEKLEGKLRKTTLQDYVEKLIRKDLK